jgi:hypothetical protein
MISPVLSEDFLMPTQPAGGSLPQPREGMSTAKKTVEAEWFRSRTRLGLGDVIDSNIELEAETYIIQALEERDPVRSRFNTDNSQNSQSILSHVPAMDEIVHDFSFESASHEGGAASSTPSGITNEHSVPPSPRPRVDPPLPSTSSASPQPPPLSPPKPKQSHRRQMTVEQTIFGLTSALSAINAVHENNLDYENIESGDANEQIIGEASADRLARTVDILVHRNRTKTEDMTGATSSTNGSRNRTKTDDLAVANDSNHDIDSLTTSASSRRRTQDDLPNYKKTDEIEHLEEIPDSEHGTSKEGRDIEQGTTGTTKGDDQQSPKGRNKKNNHPWRHLRYGDIVKEEWDVVQDFLRPRRTSIYLYCRIVSFYLLIPLLGIAVILFYLVENPPTGRGPSDSQFASSSYWLIFFVRNIITFTFAKVVEVFVIDFLFLQTKVMLRLVGPLMTLLVVQSKGWPFLLSIWGILDLTMLAGDNPFARHWLYWQDAIALFNSENPGGDVTSSERFYKVLVISVAVGAVVSLKRLFVGLYLGRKTFCEASTCFCYFMIETKRLTCSSLFDLPASILFATTSSSDE